MGYGESANHVTHEHFVWSTASDDRRKRPDDVDIKLYSLRKWAGMAAKGNATALHFLFAETRAVEPDTWRKSRHGQRFFCRAIQPSSFGDSLTDSSNGLPAKKAAARRDRGGNIHLRFGYDAKAAMHGLRLLYGCLELMKYGKITLPRPERELLIEVRTGVWTFERVLAQAQRLFKEVEDAVAASPGEDRSGNDFAISGASAVRILGLQEL